MFEREGINGWGVSEGGEVWSEDKMVTWQYASSLDKNYIFELATTMGWYDDPPRVQVKKATGMNPWETWYVIEPYEETCTCPDLIHPPERVKP